MKKIIATVLAMVMALALCTTAFAADTKVKGYMQLTDGTAVQTTETTLVYKAAKDPKVVDGKTTEQGNVAYYYIEGAEDYKYVTVSTLAEADVVMYSKLNSDSTKGEGVIMYLAYVLPEYYVGKTFTNFGDKCGQYSKPADFDSTATYYVAEQRGDDTYYVSCDSDEVTASLMVNGKLVGVKPVSGISVVEHVAVPTVENGKVTGYACSKCGVKAVKAGNVASIPENAQRVTGTLYYFAAGTTTPSTDKNTSPKTFDAGIAMYVGMALTSVAGSAVVIGKKKEF